MPTKFIEDGKSFTVVYERRAKKVSVPPKNTKVLGHFYKKMVNEQEREPIWKRFAVLPTDNGRVTDISNVFMLPQYDRTNNCHHLKLTKLIEAADVALKQENLICEKFISEVETLSSTFQPEFNKWLDAFEKVQHKLTAVTQA